MKRKILSILVALIVCISPMFFFAGCGENENSKVVFPTGFETGWSITEGQTFKDIQWTTMDATITYVSESFDDTANNGKGGMVEKEETITVKDAIAQGLLHYVGGEDGFDTSMPRDEEGNLVGDSTVTRKMTLMFDDKTIDVTYTVTAKTN